MNSNPPRYNAKILLFGEYTLMSGSHALTLPFPYFGGSLGFGDSKSPVLKASNSSLKDFCTYLENHLKEFPGGLELELERFKNDLGKGMYLDSDIPQGYGVGSSGVLVASVYEAYSKNRLLPDKGSNLVVLKQFFSFMESCFHGRSSGLDPLSCYAGRPLRVYSPEKIEIVEFPDSHSDRGFEIFLLDTRKTSKTEGLVNLFLEKSKDETFKRVLKNELIPRTDNCIETLIGGVIPEFMKQVGILSALQLEHFKEMIPEDFIRVWRNGNDTGDYALKLCGSGGGGFILGFATRVERTENYLNGMGIGVLSVLKSR